MIEIILGIWLVSATVTLLLGVWNLYLINKKFISMPINRLNQNLNKIDLFWSNTQGTLLALDDTNNPNQDKKLALRQARFLFLLILFSLPGLIIMIIVLVGTHLLPSSRNEQKIFNSLLTTQCTLSAEQTRLELERINKDL